MMIGRSTHISVASAHWDILMEDVAKWCQVFAAYSCSPDHRRMYGDIDIDIDITLPAPFTTINPPPHLEQAHVSHEFPSVICAPSLALCRTEYLCCRRSTVRDGLSSLQHSCAARDCAPRCQITYLGHLQLKYAGRIAVMTADAPLTEPRRRAAHLVLIWSSFHASPTIRTPPQTTNMLSRSRQYEASLP